MKNDVAPTPLNHNQSVNSVGWRNATRLLRPSYSALVIVFGVTFLFRSLHFGSPQIDYDEPFYLLVGDRMLHGAIPYVDLWDRKPVGLFLLYAAIRLLGGGVFTTYLIVASLCVAATAGIIWALASRWISRWAAIAPAIAYVVWLEPFKGGGGQTASFYNLLTAASFWLVIRARDQHDRGVTLRHGFAAMMLIGLAIQIKYTVIPEGVFFALYTLWLLYRQGIRPLPVACAAVGFALVALAPTLVALAWYFQAGYLHEFVYANFISVFQRGRLPLEVVIHNLRFIILVSLPLAAVCATGLPRMPAKDRPLLIGWVVAALIGFALLGNYYSNYFIPMLLPLMVCATPNLVDRRWGLTVFGILLAWPVMLGQVESPRETTDKILSIQRLTRYIVPHIDAHHCLLVFDGPVALYTTTHSCLPTRFVYPDHLTNAAESGALGVNANDELRHILANRPGAIVTAVPRLSPDLNTANVALMEQALARDYSLLTTMRLGDRAITVWTLRGGNGARNKNSNSYTNSVELYSQKAVLSRLKSVHINN